MLIKQRVVEKPGAVYSTSLKSSNDRSRDNPAPVQKFDVETPSATPIQKKLGATILNLGDALNIFLKTKLQSDCFGILKKFQVKPYVSDGSGRDPKLTFSHLSSINALCAAAKSLGHQNVDPNSLCMNLAGRISAPSFEFRCTPVFKDQSWVSASEFLKLQIPSITVLDYAYKLKHCWDPVSDPFWFGCVEVAAFAQAFCCEVLIYSYWGGRVPISFVSRMAESNTQQESVSMSAPPKVNIWRIFSFWPIIFNAL